MSRRAVRRALSAAVLALGLVAGTAGGAEVLRVGTSGDYPPFSASGAGFDVEVAGRLARDWGVRIEWVPFRWPELAARVRAGDFDVAMSGVTWRPERDVAGWSSRAVVLSGPCLVGDPEAARVAVNRGGVLEAWARGRFAAGRLETVTDNLSLGRLLAGGAAGAVVTDRFESRKIARPEDRVACEPPRDRKVYWVAPARAAELGPRLDRWLAEREREIDALREKHLGVSEPRDEIDHLVDLLARRLELMPAVAAWKRERAEPVADPGREAAVLARAAREAAAHRLDAGPVRRLFEVQMRLARAVQGRAAGPAPRLDLATELRPAIGRLGDRMLASLAAAAPIGPDALGDRRLAILEPLLSAEEIAELRAALLAVRPAG